MNIREIARLSGVSIATVSRVINTPQLVQEQTRARVQEALEAVGLAGYEEQKIFRLSGGEQQRVAIARNMIKPGSIILADEPTGSVDAKNRDVILELLHMLNGQGKTIVIVTHDPCVAGACGREVRLLPA